MGFRVFLVSSRLSTRNILNSSNASFVEITLVLEQAEWRYYIIRLHASSTMLVSRYNLATLESWITGVFGQHDVVGVREGGKEKEGDAMRWLQG